MFHIICVVIVMYNVVCGNVLVIFLVLNVSYRDPC